MSSTRASSWPKDWTRFSCIAGDTLQLNHQGNPTLDTLPHLILVIRTFVALRILFLCLEFPSVHSGFLFVWFMSIPPWNFSQLFRQDLMLPEKSLYVHLYHQLCCAFFWFILLLLFFTFFFFVFSYWGFPTGSEVKASACNAGDLGSIPGLGRSPEEGNGNPLQYSCLENPIDRGAWWATVHGVAKGQTRLSDFTFTLSYSYFSLQQLK